jgi:hypothetical protein
MNQYYHPYFYNHTGEKIVSEMQQFNQRITNIELQLNHLMNILLQQQQAHTIRNRSHSEQPEPGVPSEKNKLPEQPRSVFIPPGVNGIIRM